MMIADASLHASKPLDLCVTLDPFLHMSCNLMLKCKYSREGISVPGLHCCDLQNVTWLQECMKSNTLNLRVRNGWRMENCRIKFPCYNTVYNFICSLDFTATCLKEIIMSLWWADFVCFHLCCRFCVPMNCSHELLEAWGEHQYRHKPMTISLNFHHAGVRYLHYQECIRTGD